MAGENRQPNHDMQRRLMQQQQLQEKRRLILQKPNEKCPRCDSMDTRFAYFNNFKEAQPRYFRKGCERSWTKGGKLRNVPVGGGVRPARASYLGGGLVLRPVTSQSFLLGSAGRSHFTGGLCPQAPSYNIQPQYNVAANVLNTFTSAWEAPNQGVGQLQPSVDFNQFSSTGGSFSGGPPILIGALIFLETAQHLSKAF